MKIALYGYVCLSCHLLQSDPYYLLSNKLHYNHLQHLISILSNLVHLVSFLETLFYLYLLRINLHAMCKDLDIMTFYFYYFYMYNLFDLIKYVSL